MITFLKDESGATAIEYGALTGFLLGVIVTIYGGTLYKLSETFNTIVDALSIS